MTSATVAQHTTASVKTPYSCGCNTPNSLRAVTTESTIIPVLRRSINVEDNPIGRYTQRQTLEPTYRISLDRTYVNKIVSRVSLSRIYINKIAARISLSRIYKNKIAARVSLSRIYINKISARISLSRIYQNKIIARISLSRIYKNKILQRVGAYSIDFDGTNDLVDLTNDATLWSQALTKFSFSVWIKFDVQVAATAHCVNHGLGSAQAFAFYRQSTGTMTFEIRNAANGSVFARAGSSGTVVTNVWYHLVCVYDNSLGSANMKVYLDGTVGGTTGNLTETINLSSILTLGRNGNVIDGQLKDFRWWTTKALTQTEINNIKSNSPSAPTPNYWLKMEERTGNPVDSISGTKVGTLTNGAKWVSVAPDILTGRASTYINKIIARISLSRIYKNKIIARISLSRIYKNKISARISLSRIYKNKIQARVSLSRSYINKILGRISLVRIYKNKIAARVSLSRIYKNKIQARVSLTRIYKNKIAARVSLSRIYKNRVLARVSLTRIYINKIIVATLTRISLERIYINTIQSRVSRTRTYKNAIIGRISLSRIYKNAIIGRISLTRIYKNRIALRVSLTRIYKNRILSRVSLSRIYVNKIAARISLTKIYQNRILSRISLTRIYINRILLVTRVSKTVIYINKIQGRVSLTRNYINKIDFPIKLRDIRFVVRQRIPRAGSFMRQLYDRNH